MKSALQFFQKHMVSWILLLVQTVFLILKLFHVAEWHWALVFIPLYLIALWWIIMISIGAYLTICDRKKEASQNEEND